MLRITRVTDDENAPTLKLEGRIVGPWTEELRKACDECLAEAKSVTLDFSGVTFIDPEGVRALKSLTSERVQLSGCSLFVLDLLKRGGIQGE